MKRFRKSCNDYTIDAMVLVAPLVLLMVLFIALPVLSNFYYSLTQWNGLGSPKFIGFENYVRMFQDERFIASVRNLGVLVVYIPFGNRDPPASRRGSFATAFAAGGFSGASCTCPISLVPFSWEPCFR